MDIYVVYLNFYKLDKYELNVFYDNHTLSVSSVYYTINLLESYPKIIFNRKFLLW